MRKILPPRAWMGLLIGFAGVALVLSPKLASRGAGSLTLLTVAAALTSVLAVTGGTLVQKWLAATDLRVAASLQSVGAAMVAAAATPLLGTFRWDGTPLLWGALVWAVLVPSMVGNTLLMWMMRHGDATKVTALLLLVPPLPRCRPMCSSARHWRRCNSSGLPWRWAECCSRDTAAHRHDCPRAGAGCC